MLSVRLALFLDSTSPNDCLLVVNPAHPAKLVRVSRESASLDVGFFRFGMISVSAFFLEVIYGSAEINYGIRSGGSVSKRHYFHFLSPIKRAPAAA